MFIDYAAAGTSNPLWKAFYLVTGLGHQAVMVFFVFSGYFVGGSVLSAMQRGEFAWSRYSAARLSRLWTLIVPALVLTLLIDSVGRHFAPAAYEGRLAPLFSSSPTALVPASLSPLTFLANLGFLQTIQTPGYGSNGPLWSLANEFWYYVLFPLLATGLAGLFRTTTSSGGKRRILSALGSLALAALILFWLPVHLSSLGLVWMMGVAIWWISKRLPPIGNRLRIALGALFFTIFTGSLLASKANHWAGSDWMVGATFAVWMLPLLGPWSKPGWGSRLSTGLSEISYTLYVRHFPILFFVAAVLMQGRQLHPGSAAAAIFASLAIGILVISAALWWAFERNTPRVRKWMA